jgi:hypothetical protein
VCFAGKGRSTTGSSGWRFFTDGTVNNADGDRLLDDVFYYAAEAAPERALPATNDVTRPVAGALRKGAAAPGPTRLEKEES